MILPLIRRPFGRNRASTNPRLNQFIPELRQLEDRVTPAAITWVGNGTGNGALWSVPANWNTNAVPGANDTAIFDATVNLGANTDSTMDLGGVGAYHVGKLVFKGNYNKTFTLNAHLYVDILDMQISSSATIKGKGLSIIQQTTANDAPAATMFGTSKWSAGTFENEGLEIFGDNAHGATLRIDSDVNLKTDMSIFNAYSSVEWTGGDVNVAKGKAVDNRGTFKADSDGGTMGSANMADKWTFQNRKDLLMGKGKFGNVDLKKVGGDAREFKISSASTGADVFRIAGTFTQDVAGTLSIESGTLEIDGPFTQSTGSVTVAAGTSLEVTGTYALSGGTVAVNFGASLSVGSYDQSGGTASLQYATLTSASGATVSGGTLALANGQITSAGTVQVQSGGTLSGSATVNFGSSSGTLTNAGTITVDGVLAVLGNYTQTGVLNLVLYEGYSDRLEVSGLAALGGVLNVDLSSSAPDPSQGDSFEVLTYGSRSGTFGTINLPPPLPPGNWGPGYDDPLYPNALGIWVDR